MYGWISINVNMFFDYHLAKYAYWCMVQKQADMVCPLQFLLNLGSRGIFLKKQTITTLIFLNKQPKQLNLL